MHPTILPRRFAPAASAQSYYLKLLGCFLLSQGGCATSMASAAAARTATTTMHSPTHRRLREPLRRQGCTARSRFTWPAWPRRALRSHHQRDPGETRFFNTIRADYKKSLGRIFGAATPLGALVNCSYQPASAKNHRPPRTVP
jgi:hypothetical protein